MKLYVSDYNGILTAVKKAVRFADPDEADALVLWQDCQGSWRELVKTCKRFFSKPVYVVQHGRRSSYDYGAPLNKPLMADKYLAWGQADKDYMTQLGYGDRVEVVGCPLNNDIKPKTEHKDKVVLFIPVNTGKEEPENLAVYYELLRIKYDNAKRILVANKSALKDHWGFNGRINVDFNELSVNMDVVAKLLPWHDQNLYHGKAIAGYQHDPSNNKKLFDLLRNVDLVVGLDEGTSEIFAYGHDIPVIIVDGFVYHQHGEDGKTKMPMDIHRTEAAVHVTLDKLQEAVEYALAHPEHKREERKAVAERELGISLGDPVKNILKVVGYGQA